MPVQKCSQKAIDPESNYKSSNESAESKTMKHLIVILLIVLLACTAQAQTNGLTAAQCSQKVNDIMAREGGAGAPTRNKKLLERGRIELEEMLPLAKNQQALDVINSGIAGNCARSGDMAGALKAVALISDPAKRERRQVEVYWYAKGFQAAFDELAKLMADKSIPPERKLMLVAKFRALPSPEAQDSAPLMAMAASVLTEAKIDEDNIREATALYTFCKSGANQGVFDREKLNVLVETLSLLPNELGTKARNDSTKHKGIKAENKPSS